jgi:hypothetical protein
MRCIFTRISWIFVGAEKSKRKDHESENEQGDAKYRKSCSKRNKKAMIKRKQKKMLRSTLIETKKKLKYLYYE